MPNHGGVPCVAARVATRRGYRRKAIRRPNRDATQRRSCPAYLPGKQSPKAALLYFGAHAGRDSELSAPGGAFSAFADSAGGSGSVGAKPQAIRAQSRTTGRAFLIIVEARAGYQDQRPSPQGRAFLHRAGLCAAEGDFAIRPRLATPILWRAKTRTSGHMNSFQNWPYAKNAFDQSSELTAQRLAALRRPSRSVALALPEPRRTRGHQAWQPCWLTQRYKGRRRAKRMSTAGAATAVRSW